MSVRRGGSICFPATLIDNSNRIDLLAVMVMRQIRLAVARVGILAALIVTAAPAPARAAQADIFVDTITVLSSVKLSVNGYATCSEPTGQAKIVVWAVQFSGSIPSGQGSTTITCGSGIGSWAVTVTTNILNPWHSGHLVQANAQIIRAGIREDQSCIRVTAW